MSRKPYFEHDDRVYQDNYRNMGRNRNRKFNQRGGRGAFQSGQSRFRDLDEDDMNFAGPSNAIRRYNPYKPQGGQSFSSHNNRNRISQGRNLKMGVSDPANRWYKITVPHAKKEGKKFVLTSLLSNCKVPFVPFSFKFEGNKGTFYVDNYNTARNLADISKRITLPDGFRMSVFMSAASAPVTIVDEETVRKIEMCMNNRYDVSTHSLNLKKFHFDPDLRHEGLYASLQQPLVLKAVLKIIKERMPEIMKLDISDNGLYTLRSFSILVPVCTQLTILSLENNKLKSIKEMDFIKDMDIEHLILDGNMLCDDYKEKDTYINTLRGCFPKLVTLDGHALPPQIGFDLGTVSLPPSKGSFLSVSEDVKCSVISFLEEYYTVYDSDNREKLLEKYNNQATFSLVVLKPPKNIKDSGLDVYINESRNLMRVSETNIRCKLLKQGRLSVVAALSKFPQTQHDPNSFTVDISLVFPKFIVFSVTGVFREVAIDMVNQPIRTFQRTFLILNQDERWDIFNDMLTIAEATPEQVKAFKCPAPTPSPSPAPSTGDKSPNEKHHLLLNLMNLTGMNIDFSTKCLDENEWDFQKAAAIFQELNKVPGRIPEIAFVTDERQQLVIELMKFTGMTIEFSAKCLTENDWDFNKATMIFQELNALDKIPPEAFIYGNSATII